MPKDLAFGAYVGVYLDAQASKWQSLKALKASSAHRIGTWSLGVSSRARQFLQRPSHRPACQESEGITDMGAFRGIPAHSHNLSRVPHILGDP